MPDIREKKYVDVVAKISADGDVIPLKIIWDDGRKFEITNIKEILPRKYSKCGGVGVRYTCQIGRAQTYLYNEVDRWFVEAKGVNP